MTSAIHTNRDLYLAVTEALKFLWAVQCYE